MWGSTKSERNCRETKLGKSTNQMTVKMGRTAVNRQIKCFCLSVRARFFIVALLRVWLMRLRLGTGEAAPSDNRAVMMLVVRHCLLALAPLPPSLPLVNKHSLTTLCLPSIFTLLIRFPSPLFCPHPRSGHTASSQSLQPPASSRGRFFLFRLLAASAPFHCQAKLPAFQA